jgi:hypothetical protein
MENGFVGSEGAWNGCDEKPKRNGLDSHVIRHDVDTDLYSMASTMALT